MADKEFRIDLVTTGDPAGAEKVAQSLDGVGQAAERAKPQIHDYIAELATAEESAKRAAATEAELKRQMEERRATGGSSRLATDPNAALAGAAEVDKAADAEARRNSLIQQRQAILSTETEMMEAQAAGQAEEAAALGLEIEEMREALALQVQGSLTEAEAGAMAKDRVYLRERERLELQAQRELNAQLVAEEEALQSAGEARLAQHAAELAVLREEIAAVLERNGAESSGIGMQAGRGIGREAGLGRSTGLAAAFGPEGLTVAVAIAAMVKMYEGLGKASEDAAKQIMEDNKRVAASAKEVAEATRKSFEQQTQLAEAYIKVLDEIDAKRDRKEHRLDREMSTEAHAKSAAIDEKARADVVALGLGGKDGDSNAVARAKILAKAKEDKAQIESDDQVSAASRKTGLATQEEVGIAGAYRRAESDMAHAQDAQSHAERTAEQSRGAAEAARQHTQELTKKIHKDAESANAITGLKTLIEGKPKIAFAKRQETAANDLAKRDEEAALAAANKTNALAAAMQKLADRAADATEKVADAEAAQKEVSDAAAAKTVAAHEEGDREIRDAQQRDNERLLAEKARQKEATEDAKKELSREDKADEPPRAPETHGESSPGAPHPHASARRDPRHGPHHDPHTHPPSSTGHKDGLSAPADFDAAFHGGLRNGNPATDFERAFGANAHPHPIDTRTQTDKMGAANQTNSAAGGVIEEAKQMISQASGKTEDTHTQQLIAAMRELMSAVKGQIGGNKDDSRSKQITVEVLKLKDEIDELKSQFQHNR